MHMEALDRLKERVAYRTPNLEKPLQQIVLQRADAESLVALFDALLGAIARLGKLVGEEAKAEPAGVLNDVGKAAVKASGKPFAGVISSWREEIGCIVGICEWHATYDNYIVRDGHIQTSPVVSILRNGLYAVAETRNSIYVLVRPRQ